MRSFSWKGSFACLKKASPEDSRQIARWEQEGIFEHLHMGSFPKNREEIIQEIQKSQNIEGKNYFFIEDFAGKPIGLIKTNGVDCKNGIFQYSIFVEEAFRRQSYGADAVEILLKFYFQELRFQKVSVFVPAFNKPAALFHEKFGFVLEGRMRNMIFTRGQFFDLFLYGMTGEEFQNLHMEKNDAEMQISNCLLHNEGP